METKSGGGGSSAPGSRLPCSRYSSIAISTLPVFSLHCITIKVKTVAIDTKIAGPNLKRFLMVTNRFPKIPTSAGYWTKPTVTHEMY